MEPTFRWIGDCLGRTSSGPLRLIRRWHPLQIAVLAATVVLIPFATHSQTSIDAIEGVYPAQGQDELALYAILQRLPLPPDDIPVPSEWRGGILARVMITAGRSGATTSARRRAGDGPCRRCTAQHFFLLPKGLTIGRARDISALRHPPGAVTYLYVKGKEYALVDIRVRRTADGLHLERADLMRTGFRPPIFKERLRLRLEAPLNPGSRSEELVATALADIGETEPDFQ